MDRLPGDVYCLFQADHSAFSARIYAQAMASSVGCVCSQALAPSEDDTHHADKPEAETAEDDTQRTDQPQAETAAKSKSATKLAKTGKPAPGAAPSSTPQQPAAAPSPIPQQPAADHVSGAELPAGTGLDGDQAVPTDKGKRPQVRKLFVSKDTHWMFCCCIWPLIG